MTTTEQNTIIREAMHLWPKNETFPYFEPDLHSWYARSNDHHKTVLGTDLTIVGALLEAARFCAKEEPDGRWDEVIGYLENPFPAIQNKEPIEHDLLIESCL